MQKLGNGRHTHFWNDNWSPYGNISEFLQLQPHSRLGIPRNATISDLFIDGNWILPPARSEAQVLLQCFISAVTQNRDEDHYDWEINNKIYTSFSTGIVYSELKHHNPIVPWFTIVWLRQGIPRHSFLSWLMFLNSCPTRDRFLRWGLPTDSTCFLCNYAPESRDHLFFACNYSS